MDLNIINYRNWIKENETFFVPPICNKLMHNNQLKVFFVGGPNQRNDYHIEEGEELFYMIKGDMSLKVVEKDLHKDIIIKEGEVFLLPSRIPHSPQRKQNTIGLVIERERHIEEKDALRYYINNSNDILFERWFYCEDLGTQLGPLIKEFFSSEEYKTGKPNINSIVQNPPYFPNKTIELVKPFNLNEWLENNETEINDKGYKSLFASNFKTQALVFGGYVKQQIHNSCETFLLQLRNISHVESDSRCLQLEEGNTLLIPNGMRCSLKLGYGGYTLAVSMPAPKTR